jgi:hypothetical protein
MVQVIFIVLRKTVQRVSQLGHAVIFLFVLLAFIAFNYKTLTFNYTRIWLWTILSLLAVFWGGTLATLNLMTTKHVVYPVLLFIGWAFLVVTGILLQRKKFPSMLENRKGVNIKDVFKFAFRR